jgi:hypothetical protein
VKVFGERILRLPWILTRSIRFRWERNSLKVSAIHPNF